MPRKIVLTCTGAIVNCRHADVFGDAGARTPTPRRDDDPAEDNRGTHRRHIAVRATVLLTPSAPSMPRMFIAFRPSRPIRCFIVPVGPAPGLVMPRASRRRSRKPSWPAVDPRDEAPSAPVSASPPPLAAKSPPDGYTLLFTTPTPIVRSPWLRQQVDYDPVRDFEPVRCSWSTSR